ncbi:MAG: HAMP domain-containing histidine kinase [Saprospiraceae bacterium]|nr:HAMP domain-containing histidine kinase [Saprospiraceae bacterium]MBP8892446.1 HAMP domain-containing histidine kinase [Saprospiraceae bacterium]
MKIRVKLTLQFFLVVATILIFSMFFVYSRFKRITDNEYYNNLKTKAHMTAEMVLHDGDLEKIEDITPQNDKEGLPISDKVIIFNSKNEKVFSFNRNRSDGIPFNVIEFSESENTYRQGDIYYYGLPFTTSKGSKYYVLASSFFNSKELMDLRQIILLAIVLGLLFVAISGFFYTRQALNPLFSIVTQMNGLDMSKLEGRLESSQSKDEIEHLISSINNLLSKIQNSFTFQKMFISNVSHELKNPISVVLSQVDVLLSQSNRTVDEYRNTLASLREDVKEIADITENLLQMAKMKAEGFMLEVKPFQLDEAILECQSKLQRANPDYTVNFDIIGRLESEKDLTVIGNDSLLKLAFLNLMDNCCKFSPDKKVNISIESNDGVKVLRFQDNGYGIKAEEMEHIFQPFYRNTKSKHIKGYGIGLSLTDTIFNAHQIKLEIQSEPNVGSLFTVKFG